MTPSDPVSAATHRDPYPYYAALRARGPLVFDPPSKTWVAAPAQAVSEVLGHPQCHVRPVAQRVPDGVAGTAAGAVFGRLVRMNEGAAHAPGKRALAQGLKAVDPSQVQALALRHAQALAELHGIDDPARLDAWMFDLPVHVVAQLLGWPAHSRAELSRWTKDFVACLSPRSTAEQLAAAGDAAWHLLERMKALVEAGDDVAGGLLAQIRQAAEDAGWHDADALVANLVGLLSQTHDAAAGLVGNSIVALLQRPALLAQVRGTPALVPALVREVARFDPSVQNTRRFVASPTQVCGVSLQPGDTILVLLAAASRDPALHPDAEVFSLTRQPAELMGFGAGRHRCPGQDIAVAIAAGAVAHLVQRPAVLNAEAIRWTYRPSVNARIPLFSSP